MKWRAVLRLREYIEQNILWSKDLKSYNKERD